jgi:hypothetical protein
MGRRRWKDGVRRCVVAGCEWAVAPGRAVCAGHARTREGRRATAAVQGMVEVAMRAVGQTDRRADRQNDEERRVALAEGFRRRVEAGEYRELLDGRLRRVMEQGAARDGLAEEMGAARFVLMRLLAEEEDLGKLALGVSRIITAAARVARARKAIGEGRRTGWRRRSTTSWRGWRKSGRSGRRWGGTRGRSRARFGWWRKDGDSRTVRHASTRLPGQRVVGSLAGPSWPRSTVVTHPAGAIESPANGRAGCSFSHNRPRRRRAGPSGCRSDRPANGPASPAFSRRPSQDRRLRCAPGDSSTSSE